MTMEGWGGFPESDWHRRVYVLFRRLEHMYQACNILNFLCFLRWGRYRTLLERVLLLRLVYVRSRVARQVSFEFMNQQLAWQSLSEFMLFLLPLINFAAIGRGALWAGRLVGLVAPAPKRRAMAAGEVEGRVIDVADALALGCPYCSLKPACQPTVAHPCGHIFCYYCLSSNRLAEAQLSSSSSGQHGSGPLRAIRAEYSCPACQQAITGQAALSAQVAVRQPFAAASSATAPQPQQPRRR